MARFATAVHGGGAVLAQSVGLAMRSVLRPIAQRGRLRPAPLESGRRLILVQLDGVSRSRLEWAIREGRMPFLERRLATGRSRISSCHSGTPASTPAFQSGLLYGVAPSVPGFVWYDRRRGRQVRMDCASDAAAVEERLASAAPGLLRGGTSYFSIFSGGAALPHFCLSGLAGDLSFEALTRDLNHWDTLASGLVHSVTLGRMAGRLAAEAVHGLWEGLRWSVSLGRLKHEPRFFLHRLLVGAFMRELAVQGLVIDVSRGVPVIFCGFVGYDEVAHRRGPDAEIALEQLASIDRALAVIFAAAEAAPELRYDVFVFSDHGQVATRPFECFTGLTLPEYLAFADGGIPVPVALERDGAERLAQARSLRSLLRRAPSPAREWLTGVVDEMERGLVGHALGFARADGVVTAEAGDLAHVYFVDEREPLDFPALQARHPDVLSALRESHAVGLVAVRNGGGRGTVLVRGEQLDLDDPADVARLPHPAPNLLATYLADLLSIPDAGDLVVLGWRGPERPSVAYAWEFGSHGGIAPEETETFFIHPRRCAFRFEGVVRPDELYRFFDAHYRSGHPRARPGVVATETVWR